MKFAHYLEAIDQDKLISKPEKTFKKLIALSKTNSLIVINIAEFCDILAVPLLVSELVFQSITEREILKSGLYGYINQMALYVDKCVAPGTFWDEEKAAKLLVLK